MVARICWGVQGHMLALLRNFGKCGAVWCVLKYILSPQYYAGEIEN